MAKHFRRTTTRSSDDPPVRNGASVPDKPATIKPSRRAILGGSAILAGGALVGGFAGAKDAHAASPPRGRLTADVCVVGAGFAGLTAAYRLKKAGAKVIVLEARNRIGGRSLSAPLHGGGWIDLGGQWVGSTQKAFYALIKEMGGETYPSPGDAKLKALQRSILKPDEFVRVENELAVDPKDGLDLMQAGFKLVDDLAQTLDPEMPWTHRDAEQLDAKTFAQWLRENVENENARDMVGAEVGSVACASPEEISILEMAYLVRACDSIDHLFEGAQDDRLIHGTQPIAKALADKLGHAVHLSAPARRIQWNEKGAIVFSDEISAAVRHVIVATPPHLAGAIEYDPSPPTNRVQVTQRWPQGLVIKIAMVYSEPYWRKDGLNGASLDYRGIVGETADSGVPENHSKQGIMTGFVYAAQARKVAALPAEERKKIVLGEMVARFGPKAAEPVYYHEMNWSTQQWTRGCFTGFLTPGATTLFKSAVRDPVGPLHWAGTENSTVWPSFIEGAIVSGEREAKAIIKLRG
jgi:monoamine oxidase